MQRQVAYAFLFTVFTLPGVVSAAEVWLPVTDDAYINARQPGVNFGSYPDLIVHDYGPKDTLLRFDAAAIAGQTIARAELSFDLTALKLPGQIDLYAVTTSWNESTVTWNNAPATESSAFASTRLDTSDVGGRVSVDVTSLVRRWADGSLPDAGLTIRTIQGIKAKIASQEATAGLPATLKVETGAGAPAATETVIDLSDAYVIRTPGLYVLDRDWVDIELSDPDNDLGIIIVEASDVTIDFRGHVVAHQLSTVSTIEVIGDNVTIRNGSIHSRSTDCISSGRPGSTQAVGTRIIDMHLRSDDAEVISVGNSAEIHSTRVAFSRGIWVGEGSVVSNSELGAAGTQAVVTAGIGSRISENVIYPWNVGSGVRIGADSVVAANVFAEYDDCGCTLITVDGSGSTIKDNVAFEVIAIGETTGATGIAITEGGNIIDGNLLSSVNYGIVFTTSGNYYGDNRVSAAREAFSLGSTSQTDWGGNVSF